MTTLALAYDLPEIADADPADSALAIWLYDNAATRDTGFKVAACAAVGLHYWGDHPGRTTRGRYVWAVDDERKAHIVHITGGATTSGTAEHVCERAAKRTDGKRRVWRNTPFVNDHGVTLWSGYETVNGIKDSFRGTHIPQCGGQHTPPVTFDLI